MFKRYCPVTLTHTRLTYFSTWTTNAVGRKAQGKGRGGKEEAAERTGKGADDNTDDDDDDDDDDDNPDDVK